MSETSSVTFYKSHKNIIAPEISKETRGNSIRTTLETN
jgi:hypothetical protein